MKTIVFLVLTICITSGCFAQQNFKFKTHPRIDFESGRLAMDSTYFSFEDLKKNPDILNFYQLPKKGGRDYGTMEYRSNMPIVGQPWIYTNMPIAVPDSTVNYAIRVKQIKLFKSLGRE